MIPTSARIRMMIKTVPNDMVLSPAFECWQIDEGWSLQSSFTTSRLYPPGYPVPESLFQSPGGARPLLGTGRSCVVQGGPQAWNSGGTPSSG